MTPIKPTVVRVSPRCSHCGIGLQRSRDGKDNLILGDGPVICHGCLHMRVRLAGASRNQQPNDPREGQWR